MSNDKQIFRQALERPTIKGSLKLKFSISFPIVLQQENSFLWRNEDLTNSSQIN